MTAVTQVHTRSIISQIARLKPAIAAKLGINRGWGSRIVPWGTTSLTLFLSTGNPLMESYASFAPPILNSAVLTATLSGVIE